MTLATRTVTLPGGLQATLVHQPQADRAAALVRVAAGSHHEPSRFPGLAHLLEHLLFYGGERYRNDERLMSWVQRQAGNVNATTLSRHSAFFFEVAAEDLADGVARLQEMLQAPLLLRDDIQREVAVIDAENGLIQQHELSRREAAVRHAAIALGRALERELPDLVTTAWWKEERGARVFVDYNQMARDRTMASAWSVRARPGAPVSTPVTWPSLSEVDPAEFTLRTVPRIRQETGNPWASLGSSRFDISPLLDLWHEDVEERGLGEMPFPPDYPKMPGEPPRVQPSRARRG